MKITGGIEVAVLDPFLQCINLYVVASIYSYKMGQQNILSGRFGRLPDLRLSDLIVMATMII